MSKMSRRLKKIKKNKTYKMKGGDETQNIGEDPVDNREGIIDKVENELKPMLSTAGNIFLNSMGLEKINKTPEDIGSTQKLGEMVSSGKNMVNNVATNTINNVNEVIGSNIFKEGTREVATNLANNIKDNLQIINDAVNQPEVKEQINQAAKNAGETATLLIQAAQNPLNEGAAVLGETIPKVANAGLSGTIKLTTDAMAAVPGVGAIVEVGKMLNDGSKAASAAIEAGSEAIETVSDMYMKTKANYDNLVNKLNEQKRLANQISNRTTQSINQFQNPLQAAGSRRTRRRLLNRKAKSKRVRFAF
jgi:hypothetical protein